MSSSIKYKIISTGFPNKYEVRSYVGAKFFTKDIVCENFVCEGTYEYCDRILNMLNKDIENDKSV